MICKGCKDISFLAKAFDLGTYSRDGVRMDAARQEYLFAPRTSGRLQPTTREPATSAGITFCASEAILIQTRPLQSCKETLDFNSRRALKVDVLPFVANLISQDAALSLVPTSSSRLSTLWSAACTYLGSILEIWQAKLQTFWLVNIRMAICNTHILVAVISRA
jgi:hypothetical protein